MVDDVWKTAITKVEPNKLLLRGYRIDELMGKISYPEALYLAVTGELPSKSVGKMLEIILVSSVDHGPTPPSVLAALNVATGGAPLNAAIAAGILAISEWHGGAIEKCMVTLEGGVGKVKESGKSIDEVAKEIATDAKARKKRLSGFGHRIHTKDPRTVKLFQTAEEEGVAGDHIKMARALEKAISEASGKNLPINVDGAIAALLSDIGIPSFLANSFFIVSRIPGLVAHIYEERTRERPMRRINPLKTEYDGPPERSLP